MQCAAFADDENRERSNLSPPFPLHPTVISPSWRDMFSSSVRRVALSAPPSPIVSSFSSTAAPRAAVSLSTRGHQRRFSSSKPSSPADGSNGIAEGQTVPAAPAKARPEGEAKSRSIKKKAKDVATKSTVKGRDESMLHLPSVPSTQHIAPSRKYI